MHYMLKVHSYKRSGTNLLMALLSVNFDFGCDLSGYGNTYSGNKWIESGKEETIIPWGKLCGQHDYHQKIQKGILDERIYIYRHPLDVMRSYWEFQGKLESLNEFCCASRIVNWKFHVEGFINGGVYLVRYDELCANPNMQMDNIRNHWNLKTIDGNFHPITKRVGWKEKALMSDDEGYDDDTLNRFRNILGSEYKGFRI